MNRFFPYRYRVFALIFFLIFVTYLDRICIGLVGVRMKNDFHLTNTQWGWVLGAFALAYALFEIPSAAWGDKIGQRALLMRIVMCWSILTALTGLTTGLISLLIVRFLFGAGESGAFPNSCGVITRWFPVSETSKAISATQVGVATGSAVAPLIVIPIAVAFGWRATFFVNAFIGLLWVLICFLWYRNHPSEMKGISEEEKILIERNRQFKIHAQNFPWRAAFKNRRFIALLISYFCNQYGFFFFIGWFPVYLQLGRHLTEDATKTTIAFFFVTGIAGALASGFLNDHLAKKRGLKFGRRFFGSFPLFFLGLCFFVAGITPINLLAIACLFLGYFLFTSAINASFSICVDIGGNRSGTVSGIMNCFGQIGAFVSSVVFGKTVDLTNGFSAPMFVIGGIMITGSIFSLLIDPTKRITVIRPMITVTPQSMEQTGLV